MIKTSSSVKSVNSALAIVIDDTYRWRKTVSGTVTCWWVGSLRSSFFDLERLDQCHELTPESLAQNLSAASGFFAFIIQTPEFIFAAVDKTRSYPVFAAECDGKILISNAARKLRDAAGLTEFNPQARLEMSMAGYVTGAETLFAGLTQLQAGECIYVKRPDGNLVRKRYYLYYSANVRHGTEESLIEELDQVTDRIFKNLIEDVGDRPVWVPLSGGLDSRLIVYKLKKLGCPRLNTFSYGPPGNYEAKIAKHVANQLGVAWHFLPSDRVFWQRYFWSDERRDYWRFADGLYLVPNIHWIESTKRLLHEKLLTPDAVFINGQSGDFIQGAHVPELKGLNPGTATLLHKLVAKHYSLRLDLSGDPKTMSFAEERIRRVLKDVFPGTIEDYPSFAKALELWEWQERQCKRVLNGQRTYDYFGFDWRLPLWDDLYLRFWVDVPLEFKLHRRLFVKHLETTDTSGVFRGYHPVVPRWTASHMPILFLGRFIKLVCGESVSRKYYRFMDYFSQYAPFYAPFSYREYIRKCNFYNSPLAYYGDVYNGEKISSV